jgi:rod shape-determining protein MreC
MVVRTPDGLIGQVSEVSALSSQVMLLTDADSGVGAMVVREGKVRGVGIVQGGGRARPLEIIYLKREDDIRPGDRVVSSGYGGIVPADIPIGTITSIREDAAKFLKSGYLRPAAALERAREVLLLRR